MSRNRNILIVAGLAVIVSVVLIITVLVLNFLFIRSTWNESDNILRGKAVSCRTH